MTSKENNLKEYISKLGRVCVAFSAGVDSTYLLSICKEVLGDNVVAITSSIESFPQREAEEGIKFCQDNNIKHITVNVNQLEIPGFADNPADKCYLCKGEIFGKIIEAAQGWPVVEGSNMDDIRDYRPGLKAIEELGILSPLKECQLTKAEIRKLSLNRGLNTWDKPSLACLATRIAYGEPITYDKIQMVEAAENYLFNMGIKQARVRIHQSLARIEVEPCDILKVAKAACEIDNYLRNLGFKYVSLDLGGYKSGKMNELL